MKKKMLAILSALAICVSTLGTGFYAVPVRGEAVETQKETQQEKTESAGSEDPIQPEEKTDEEKPGKDLEVPGKDDKTEDPEAQSQEPSATGTPAVEKKERDTVKKDTQISKAPEKATEESQRKAAATNAVDSNNTRIKTGVTGSQEDSLTWPGAGTKSDPKVCSVETAKDEFKAQTVDVLATINGVLGTYSRMLSYGENQIDLQVVARDKTTVTWYRLNVTRKKEPQNDTPNARSFSVVSASTSDSADGKIVGFDSEMRYDYKLKTDSEWTSLPANATEATGLRAGTYLIRYGETQDHQAGLNSVEVRVPVAQAKTIKVDAGLEQYQIQVPSTANAGEKVTLTAHFPESSLIKGIKWKEDSTGGFSASGTLVGTQTVKKDDTGYLCTYEFTMVSYNIILRSIEMETGEWHQVNLDASQKWDVSMKVTGSDSTSQNNVPFYKKGSKVEITLTHLDAVSNEMVKVTAYDVNGEEVASADGETLVVDSIEENLTVKGSWKLIPADFTGLDAAKEKLPEDLEMLTSQSRLEIDNVLITEDAVRRLGAGNQDFVDDYVRRLLDAISHMEYRGADYTDLQAALDRVPGNLDIYTEETVEEMEAARDAAQKAVDEQWDIRRQDEINELTENLAKALDALVKKPAKTPEAPKLVSKTDVQIVVEMAEGQEYSIDGGKTWQESGTFSGLDPAKKYEIVARVQETDTSGVSAASEALTVTTEKSQVEAPKKPELESVTSTAIKVKTVEGQEYSIDGGKTWQKSGNFTGLSAGKSYEVITRVAETDTTKASEASEALTVTTEKSQAEAPKKPELESVTSTAIKVKTVEGQEYSIDGGKTWQKSGNFTGLSAGKSYEVITRVAETDTTEASAASEPLKVTTKTTAASNLNNRRTTATAKSTTGTKTTSKSAAKTGDETDSRSLFSLLAASGLGIAGLSLIRRRRETLK